MNTTQRRRCRRRYRLIREASLLCKPGEQGGIEVPPEAMDKFRRSILLDDSDYSGGIDLVYVTEKGE